MEPTTTSIMSAAGLSLKGAELTYKGWGWCKRWWYGSISFNLPGNFVRQEWVDLHGVHNMPKGVFWLLTHDGDKYWAQTRITLHSDGTWAEKVNVGNFPNPRKCYVVLAWTSDFMDAILRDWKNRSDKANFWGPLEMKPPKREFQVVQEVVMNVLPDSTPAAT